MDIEAINDMLTTFKINKLEDHTIDTLGGPLTFEEVTESFRKVKNRKAPGSDGFRTKFYKHWLFFFKEQSIIPKSSRSFL